MLERLGLVLYWAGCILALPFAVIAVIALVNAPSADKFFYASLAGVCALVIWLVGRGCKFIFAGR
ncbi:MAG: hypothetical protein GEU95_21655 [Rhizobiales bacterium]|nr:hypothetical protein [Hyphomicrobiales bacterium]